MMMKWKSEIREIASQRAQDYESFKKSLEKDDLIENIKSEILSRKTYEFLAAKAVVTVINKRKREYRRKKNDSDTHGG